MAVFDARQGQVLPQPVTNYYEGKALRAGIKAQELENEMAPAKFALEERRVDLSERNTEVAEKTYEQRIAEYEDMVGQRQSAMDGLNLFSGVSEINSRVQAGELSEEDALVSARDFLLQYADGLSEEAKDKADNIRAAVQDRDGLTLEEWQSIGREAENVVRYYGFLDDENKGYAPTDRMKNALSMGLTPGTPEWNEYILAADKSKSSKPKEVKPLPTPTRAEEEIVEEVSDALFKALEENDATDYDFEGSDKVAKQKIRRWIGDEAEAIQRFAASRGRAIGFSEAAEIAAKDAISFIKPPDSPGFFKDDQITWEPSPYRRGDRITGSDGVVYIVTGYDENGEPVGEPVGG